MPVVEILSCKFCHKDFEREVARGPKPLRCQECTDAEFVTAIAGAVQEAEMVRSVNPDVEAGFLYRHGKPIFRKQVVEFNRRLLASRRVNTIRRIDAGYAADVA